MNSKKIFELPSGTKIEMKILPPPSNFGSGYVYWSTTKVYFESAFSKRKRKILNILDII